MADQRKGGACARCGREVVVFRRAPNHLLHFIITVVLGLVTAPLLFVGALAWLVVWLLASVQIGGWRCAECGSRKVSRVR